MLQQGHLSSCQYGVLTLWYQHLCSMEVGHVDHYIFLQRNPKTGLTSIQDRARSEERSLSVDYLELLDSLYESWMQVLLEEGQSMTVIDLSTTAYESAAFKDHIHKICRKVDPSIYL
jgi:deoxyadenosine/deoxycytidine kinase